MYSQIASNKRKSVALLLLSIIMLASLGYVFGQASGYGYSLMLPVVFVALLLNLGSYFAGDKLALAVSGAKPITKADNPYVFRMVENLCIAAGLQMPKIYVIDDASMNAFATGRDPQHASLALTTGIISGLENEELEGVLAHELSHIKNYDIRFMMLVIMSVGAIMLLANIFLRSGFTGGMRRSNREGGGALALIGIVIAILSPLIAQLIKFAVSRRREFLADASGALLTRYPDGLANALAKIDQQHQPLQRTSEATAHLYFSNPLRGKGLGRLFSTHPPIAERIAALRGMTNLEHPVQE